MWDRNVRAFGADLQRALGELRVTIVGCGGTGSAVAEQITRLGVRHLHLIDAGHPVGIQPDPGLRLSPS